ncbi:MAG: type II secretion system protein [Candidatus Magasanikbacteria bacterium]
MILTKKAFSLIEVLITLAIFSIVTAGAFWIVIVSSRDGAIIWEQLVTQNEGKKAVEHVINYVRKAETSSAGAYALDTADPYDLIFYANVDNDSMVEKVEFWVDDGGIFKQTITKPSSTASTNMYENGTPQTTDLANNLTNFINEPHVPVFLYYDESYTGTQQDLGENFNLTDVRMVKIQLELEKDPAKAPVPLHVESTVLIRSTKTN